MTRRIPLAAAAAVLLIALAAACAPAPAPETETSATTKPTPDAPEATVDPGSPAGETDGPSAELTCETIVSEGTVAALTKQGWTAKQSEFRIGGLVLSDGLQCMWADYSTPSDIGQTYAWAEIDADTSTEAQAALLAEGWRRVGGTDGTYITQDASFALATDEDGFGMTYQFGDGWVAFADTKQGLLLIEGR